MNSSRLRQLVDDMYSDRNTDDESYPMKLRLWRAYEGFLELDYPKQNKGCV